MNSSTSWNVPKILPDSPIQAMVDLETYSLEPEAAISEIGIVLFQVDKTGHGILGVDRYTAIPETIPTHRHRCEEVMEWRKKNISIDVSKQMNSYTYMLSAASVLLCRADIAWGHGKDFDLVILKQTFKAAGMQLPHCLKDFRNWRDTRQFFIDREFDFLSFRQDIVDPKKLHDAAYDALIQTKAVIVASHLYDAKQLFNRSS